jgi:hypothetical protein
VWQVTVGVCIGIHTFTRPDAVKEAADVPMQGVFADTPENLQVAQTQPAQEPSISEVEVEVPILPEASGLYALVAKDITGQFQDLRLYAVRGCCIHTAISRRWPPASSD